MAFERLTSRFKLENGLAHLINEDKVKINLGFHVSNSFYNVAPQILDKYGKTNKWHGHLVKDLKLGFSVNRAYYILKFKDMLELSDWIRNAKTQYINNDNLTDKEDFLKYSINEFGTPSGPNYSNNVEDLPDSLQEIKFMFDVNARQEYDAKRYQQFIFDDLDEEYEEFPRKTYVNIEDISDDEEREAAFAFEDNSKKAINRLKKQDLEFKRNFEKVERESSNFADEYADYGEGIIRLNNQCREHAAKKFKD
jgi:hypothetical protein